MSVYQAGSSSSSGGSGSSSIDALPLLLLSAALPQTLLLSTRAARASRRAAERDVRAAGLALPGGGGLDEPGADEAERERDEMERKLQALGARVGEGVVRSLLRARAATLPPPGTTLEVLKLLCKDVWLLAFGKQVDHLRTNHRGVYVLQDTSFQPLRSLSVPGGAAENAKAAQEYLSLPLGFIRGALSALGVPAQVVAEPGSSGSAGSGGGGGGGPASCTFHVKTAAATGHAASGSASSASGMPISAGAAGAQGRR